MTDKKLTEDKVINPGKTLDGVDLDIAEEIIQDHIEMAEKTAEVIEYFRKIRNAKKTK